MRTEIPEQLTELISELDQYGQADSGRLAPVRDWLDRPARRIAFAVWVARRTAGRKGKTKGSAGDLLDETRLLIGNDYGEGKVYPKLDRTAAAELHARITEYLKMAEGPLPDPKTTLKNRNLHIVAAALETFLFHSDSAEHGYQLALRYLCQDHPGTGLVLSGTTRGKLFELVTSLMFTVEGYEELAEWRQAQAAENQA